MESKVKSKKAVRIVETKMFSNLSQVNKRGANTEAILTRRPQTFLGNFSLATTVKIYSSSVLSVVISLNGNTLVSGSFDRTIKLWNLTTKKQIRTLIGHLDGVQSTAIGADGKMLVSGSEDNTIKVWQVSHFRSNYP